MSVPDSVDNCPVCGANHNALDEFWACPKHGHKLQFHRAAGDFEDHRCPAHRCAYTRSAPRKPRTPSKGDPMTTVATRPSVAVDNMWHRKTHIAAVLPSHIDVKSFIGTAAAALYADPKLMQAAESSPETLLAALMECASLGHRPGTEEYYLTPRKVKGKPTVLGIEGYRGIVERMYRSGAVAKVVVREVCAKDKFRYIEGSDDRPLHSFGDTGQDGTGAGFFGPTGSIDRGPMVGVYAYAELTTGAVSRVVLLSRDDVMAARESSEGADSDYSPWNRLDGGKDHPELRGRSMWWKTAARRLEPWVPTSAEYRREQLRAAAEAARTPAPETSWSAEAVPPAQPEPAPAITAPEQPQRRAKGNGNGSRDSLLAAIGKQFDKLGLDDTEERTVYVNQLASKDPGAPLDGLTDHDLRFVLSSLGDCDDMAELLELVTPEPAAS